MTAESILPHDDVCALPLPSHMPDDATVETLFRHARSIAIVGASPQPHRTSHAIATWLMDNTDYEIYLVNPNAVGEEIRGRGFYESLNDLPVTADIVNVFRRPEYVPDVADAAIAHGATALWLQLGIVHEVAAARAVASGMCVVQNHCIKVEYDRLAERVEA